MFNYASGLTLFLLTQDKHISEMLLEIICIAHVPINQLNIKIHFHITSSLRNGSRNINNKCFKLLYLLSVCYKY